MKGERTKMGMLIDKAKERKCNEIGDRQRFYGRVRDQRVKKWYINADEPTTAE